jgi:hypothetical protein
MKNILLAVIALLLIACSIFFPTTRELERNRERWQAQGVSHYRFNLSIGCMCPWYDQMPLTIEVQDGKAVSISASNGQDVTPFIETFNRSATVEALFDIIQSAQAAGADEIRVTYDTEYGFPTSISIDYIRMAVDDEIGYYIDNFEVLNK